MVIEDLKKIKEIIDSWDCYPLPKINSPYTASLQDESKPNGFVEIKDCEGVVRMILPREDYDSIIESECNYDK
jgi:hypothetical protein